MSASGFLRHIEFCQQRDMTKFRPFVVADKNVGWVKHDVAALLAEKLPDDFANAAALTLKPASFAERSEALSRAAELLCLRYNDKPRGEYYPVFEKWGDEPLAQIDRIAIPWFGTCGYGVHVNGFVRKPDGIYMWIGERAADRKVDPGKLDNFIGGGLPIGLSIEENLCKEGMEEASVPPEIALTAKPVGSISYMLEKMNGMRNDTLFVFDLELPETFQPFSTDGEVAAFRLLPLAEVAALVENTDRFKFNCNLVIIDFLLRHNFFSANRPEYHQLQQEFKKLI